jgi:hypothetical protein
METQPKFSAQYSCRGGSVGDMIVEAPGRSTVQKLGEPGGRDDAHVMPAVILVDNLEKFVAELDLHVRDNLTGEITVNEQRYLAGQVILELSALGLDELC